MENYIVEAHQEQVSIELPENFADKQSSLIAEEDFEQSGQIVENEQQDSEGQEGSKYPATIATAKTVPVGGTPKGIQHKQLVLAAASFAEYWHDPNREPYATIEVNGSRLHVKVRSKEFKEQLCWRVYDDSGITPSNQCIEDVIRMKAGEAVFQGPMHPTYVRVAGDAETSFIDLADEGCSIIKVSSLGALDALDACKHYLRKPGMLPLVRPTLPTTKEEALEVLKELRSFCNIEDDREWLLFLVAILSALRPNGPYVIVLVVGEQGSSKSTLCKIFRRLVDPALVPLKTFPRDERNLWITASNSWMLAFDNVSKLSADMSDALCRLSTGGGTSYRKLYENDEETLFQAQRPVLLNTIDDLPLRGDLIDRSIQINCRHIDESVRMSESEFWSKFEKSESRFFGAILSLLSLVLKELPQVNLARTPRMADFTKYGIALERALALPDGTFLHAYENNRQGMSSVALEGQFTQMLLKLQLPLELTATELWTHLHQVVFQQTSTIPRWFPRNAHFSPWLNV